jgi:pimeloyl-ACP methyl ester carboxylesterase
MPDFEHRIVQTNGINMHVAEIGDGKPVIFVHGFPELWRSWRKQMPAVAAAGYRAIAPDMRGYGRTDAPKNVEDYDVHQLTGDLCGLLDDIGAEKAFFVGHDWGAWAMWFMALLHPERVEAFANLSVPYQPRSHFPPIERMTELFGENFFYIVYFQEVGPAERELSEDVRKTVLRFAWSVSGQASSEEFNILPKQGTGFLDQMNDPQAPMDWFTDTDLDYFVQEFSRTGYFGPVSWYRNIDRNWQTTPQLDGAKITQPVVFIAGTKDPVIRMVPPDGMRDWVPDLRKTVLIEGSGHWVHMENPEPVNEAILKHLADVGY